MKWIAVDWIVSPIGTSKQIGGCLWNHKMAIVIKFNLPSEKLVKTKKIDTCTWFYVPAEYNKIQNRA